MALTRTPRGGGRVLGGPLRRVSAEEVQEHRDRGHGESGNAFRASSPTVTSRLRAGEANPAQRSEDSDLESRGHMNAAAQQREDEPDDYEEGGNAFLLRDPTRVERSRAMDEEDSVQEGADNDIE